MKKIIYFVFILTFILFIYSCSDQTTNPVEPNTDVGQIEPASVEIYIEYYISPNLPNSFNVTPMIHNNPYQSVSLTWSTSSDTDVTGYEIYRRKHYLFSGQLRTSSYSLVKTITSRYTSSWQESLVFGSDPHLAIGYDYKIRSVDATHNFKSSFSAMRLSYLEEYDYLMP